MPQLVKNIIGIISSGTDGSVILVKNISGEVQQEDYVNINGYIAYLQNLTRTEYTQGLEKPLIYGLVNSHNLKSITLEIDY